MRSMWKGHLNIGFVPMPIKLGGAVGDNDLPIHQYRKSDASAIGYRKYAKADGEEVTNDEIVKGYEVPDGRVVLLNDDDFDEAYGDVSRSAETIMFTSADRIPRVAAAKSYMVAPDKGGEKMYALLAASLNKTGKVMVIKLAMRQREILAVVYPVGPHLMVEGLEWAANVRKFDFAAPEDTASDAEHQQVEALIDVMADDFDHGAYADESQAKLAALVQKRIEGGEAVGPQTRPHAQEAGESFPDLMAAVQASIEARRPVPAPRKPRAKKVAA
jgi:DNA end-binding protein Ku